MTKDLENIAILGITGIKKDTVADTIVSITVSVMVPMVGLEPTWFPARF